MLARRESRGFRLSEVGHRFYQNDVRAIPCFYLLAEYVVCLIEGHIPQRLGERAGRSYIQRDIALLPCRFARKAHACGGEFRRLARRGVFAPVRAERIGRDDVRSGSGIRAVYRQHLFGRGRIERFGRDSAGKPGFLQFRTETSVEEHKSALRKFEKTLFHDFFSSPSLTPMTAVTVFCGVIR